MKFYDGEVVSNKVFESIKRDEFQDVKEALNNGLMVGSAYLPQEVFNPLWEAREKLNEAYAAFLKAYSHKKKTI